MYTTEKESTDTMAIYFLISQFIGVMAALALGYLLGRFKVWKTTLGIQVFLTLVIVMLSIGLHEEDDLLE